MEVQYPSASILGEKEDVYCEGFTMGFLRRTFFLPMICLMLILNGQTTTSAESKKDQFPSKEVYDFLFNIGFAIINGTQIDGRMIMISNTYNAEPRLKAYHRPRRTEYTSFNFDGYWIRHARYRDPIGSRNWDKAEKRYYEEDNTPGRWHFRVRWTTRTEHTQKWGPITVVEFREVMPEVYFIEYGGLERRHDFLITDRFQVKYQQEVGYVYGALIHSGEFGEAEMLLKK
jgi:hypothetical protein